MHSVRSQAQPEFRTVRVNRNFQQPQSSKTESSDTSIATSRRQESDVPAQHSTYDAIRAADRRRFAAGERPGPNWKDEQAMKAWLEQRFPQGTEAGSPYYQFLITSSRFEDTYWLPGRGSKEVVGKLSEKEWKRWTKEKAGLVMHSTWGQNPLYPDRNEVEELIFQYSGTINPSPQPLTQEDHVRRAYMNLLHKSQDTGTHSRLEGPLDTGPHELLKGHSSRKRSAKRAQLDPGEPSVAKRFKSSPNSATSFPNLHSIPETASSSKKRTASKAEIDTNESPIAKRIKRLPGSKISSRKVNLDPFDLTPTGDGTVRKSKHAPRSRFPPPADRRAEELDHNPQADLRSLEDYDDEVAQDVLRSSPRILEEEEEEDDAMTSNTNPANKKPNTPPSETTTPNPHPLEKPSSQPHKSAPQKPPHQTIQIILPAPSTPLPPQLKKRQTKRRVTSATPLSQTRYTTMQLRSGIGKRRHTLPNFVHLGKRGRKEVQIAGCLR